MIGNTQKLYGKLSQFNKALLKSVKDVETCPKLVNICR